MIEKMDLIDLCYEYHSAECKIRTSLIKGKSVELTVDERECYYSCQGFRPDCPRYQSFKNYLEERQ